MKKLASVIRWIARVLSALTVIFMVRMGIGEGLPRPSELTSTEQMMWVGLIVMMIGALAAWKWEVAGAVVIFAGFGVKWYAYGEYPAAWYSLFPLVGLLYLIAWMLEHKPVAAAATAPVQAKKQGKKKKKSGRTAKT
jgi:hypothetical protein